MCHKVASDPISFSLVMLGLFAKRICSLAGAQRYIITYPRLGEWLDWDCVNRTAAFYA